MKLPATGAPVRMLQYLCWTQKWVPRAQLPINRHTTFWPRKWIPCPNFAIVFMYLMLLLFWLKPNFANKYSKIFSFIARARGNLRLCRWIFWAHIFFKSVRIHVQVQLNWFTVKKVEFFNKKRACARTFAQIRSKPQNGHNIHNFKLACKKSAS